jgi:small subunit ribosomal protein S9
MKPGTGVFKINNRELANYFHVEKDREHILQPLRVTDTTKRMDVFVNVCGGGTTGQAGAIVLGLARALKLVNRAYEPALRDGHFLTRDARKVERKKYGRSGARRSFQFSKR